MLDRISTGSNEAISSGPGTGIECVPDPGPSPGIRIPEVGANPGSGIDDDEWFFIVASTVFGRKETGLHLHLATGWARTSCYAFVAREPSQRRKPPVEFLRILFRSAHGQPFHAAFMHGCDAPWWRAFKRAQRIVAAEDAIDRT